MVNILLFLARNGPKIFMLIINFSMCKLKFVFVSWKSYCCFMTTTSPGHGWHRTRLCFSRSMAGHKGNWVGKKGYMASQSGKTCGQSGSQNCHWSLFLHETDTLKDMPKIGIIIGVNVKPEKVLEMAGQQAVSSVLNDQHWVQKGTRKAKHRSHWIWDCRFQSTQQGMGAPESMFLAAQLWPSLVKPWGTWRFM